jgi:hypothetical protein
MLDEKTLHDLMTKAAEEQDHLLPRSVADDLAGGRRRLFRNRLLAGTGVATAAAVVLGAIAGASLLGSSKSPGENPPVATNSATAAPTKAPTKAPSKPAKAPPRSWAGQDLGPAMRGALVRHLDPGKDHLVLDKEAITGNGQPGLRLAADRMGWKIPGQAGQGYVWLELADSERAIGKACGEGRITGSTALKPSDCRVVQLGNGRTAHVAHRGDEWEVGYVRPDGSVVYIVVAKLFGNNSTIPVHDIGITQDQLLALAQDDSLRLPPLSPAEQAEKERLFAFRPDTNAMYAALGRVLSNGRLSDRDSYFVPEQAEASATWTSKTSSAKQYVAVSVDVKSMVSECSEQVHVECTQKITLPSGRVVWFGENKQAGRMGVRYEQPDGDMAFVAVAPWDVIDRSGRPASAGPKATAGPQHGGITRDQLVRLVTDQALNDK